MASYFTLDDLPLEGSRVLVRVDINSPITDGKLGSTARIEAAAESLEAAAARDAAVVALAHQGRPGRDDFTDLEQHAEALDEAADPPVSYVPDVAGEEAIDAIRSLPPGEILLLDNVRGLEDEIQQGEPEAMSRVPYVQRLSNAVEYYANDAFPAAHRAQPSIVGFPLVRPGAVGRLMERELAALERAIGGPEPPTVFLLGGAKPGDAIEVMEHNFESGVLDEALLGGLVGELFLLASGADLGKAKADFLEEQGVLEHLGAAEATLETYGDRIRTPADVGLRVDGGRVDRPVDELPDEGTILDVGPATVEAYADRVAEAGTVFLNGPVGLYEDPPFDRSTTALLEAVAEADAFSVLGGGHTRSAIDGAGLTPDDFGYVSLAGGALLAYVTGSRLPALEALEASRDTFRRLEVA
jgi:phosphoglycerate kinase